MVLNIKKGIPLCGGLGSSGATAAGVSFGINKLIGDKMSQKDISKYIYTKDTNTPPHAGSYGDTPRIWEQKYYIIKQAMMLRDNNLRKKVQDGNK